MNDMLISLQQIKKLKNTSLTNYKYVLTKAYTIVCKGQPFNKNWVYIYNNELFNTFSIMKKNTIKNWLIAIIGFITTCNPPTCQEQKKILDEYQSYLSEINSTRKKNKKIIETSLDEVQNTMFQIWSNEIIHLLKKKDLTTNDILKIEKVVLANLYVYELPQKMSDINCLQFYSASQEEINGKLYKHIKENSIIIDNRLNAIDFVYTSPDNNVFIPINDTLKLIFIHWIPFSFNQQKNFKIKYVFYNPRKLKFINEEIFTNEFIKVSQINEGLRNIIGYGIRNIRALISFNILYGRNTKTY